MFNIRLIVKVLGLFLLVEAFFMALSGLVSLSYQEAASREIFYSSLITALSGGILNILGLRANDKMSKRDGYIVVSLVWIVFSIFGLLPFYISGAIPSITDAFFETMSGFTTTGSSILNDIESLPNGILFWRSIIQWLGGIGIIVISLSVLPILGIGASQMFAAEVPGPTPDRLTPKIKETAKRLWLVYSVLTLIETVLLKFGGMTWFDAVNHAFTTMATGGYSTKQASVAYWDSPFIQYVIIFFMFLAGTNFNLTFFAMKGSFKPLWKDEELKYYTRAVLLFTVLITISLLVTTSMGVERSFRDALFQVVSIVTTTGYATADYLVWGSFAIGLIFMLMFFGGSAGSTGGGPKIVRVVILVKNSFNELKKLIHPKAILPVRFNNRVISNEIVSGILAFGVIYFTVFMVSIVVVSSMGIDFTTSVGAVITSLGNIGPGLGDVGPAENFSGLPAVGKWYLSFLMLLGRLELFTVLVLFSPAFWKN